MEAGQVLKVEQHAVVTLVYYVSAPVPLHKFLSCLLALTGVGVSALVICL